MDIVESDMELQNDASACSKRLPAALRERRVGEHRQRTALPEHGRMGVAQHQMKPLWWSGEAFSLFSSALAPMWQNEMLDLARSVSDMGGISAYRPELQRLGEGPRFVRIKIAPGNPERALPPRDGVFVKNRIRKHLGFPVM
jgi:hypothetical protein